jgi:hypothetical protein
VHLGARSTDKPGFLFPTDFPRPTAERFGFDGLRHLFNPPKQFVMKAQQSIRFLRLFFLFGVAMLGIAGWLVVQSLRTYGWRVVDGVIRTREIKAHSSGESGTTYSPTISYEYEAAGTGYSGETIAFGMMSSSSSYDDANKYPIDKKVLVHYNPADPSEAVLEPGIHGGTWSYLGLGTAFVLVTGGVLRTYKVPSNEVFRGTAQPL